MKPWLFIPFALLLGLVIGAWGPRSELRLVREEVRELRKLLDRSPGRGRGLGGVTHMLGLAGGGETTPPVETPVDSPPATNVADEAATQPALSGQVARAAGPGRRRRRPRAGQGMRQEIERASELWRMRSDIARGTFIGDAGLSPDESAQFDVLMQSMNIRLREKISEWVETIRDENLPGPEAGARMIHDLTGVVVLTYDEMDRTLPAEWREETTNSFDATDFIDPSVAEPLIEVEDVLNANRDEPE